MERLFSTVQVAELLGVTTGVVAAWMHQGMLKAQQLPQGLVRVSERNLVSFLRNQHIDLGVMMKDIASAEGEQRQATSDKRQEQTGLAVVDVPAGGGTKNDTSPQEHSVQADAGNSGRLSLVAGRSFADDPPPVHAAEQVLRAVLREAIHRRAQSVQFTLDGQELMLALRIDGRLHGKPHFHTRLPRGLGGEIVAYALERAGLPSPSPLSSGGLTWRLDGREVAMSAWACRIGPTTRLVFTLSCEPRRVEDLLPVGHARTLQKALENRSGLILLAGPVDRCRHLLTAIRQRLDDVGRSTLELLRTAATGKTLPDLLASPERTGLDVLLVEEFSRYEDVAAVLDASRETLIVAVVPEDTPAGLSVFLRHANAPAWTLARSLTAVTFLDAEGGITRIVDATLREKIRNAQWEWGL